MSTPTPYSYARGVLNTRVQHTEEDVTLAELRERFRKPVVLEKTSEDYHSATKRVRGDVKKSLPYFVGGVIEGKRHDSNVKARTLLTLDIEAQEGQEAPPAPQDVFDMLEGLGAEGWVYTSLSHKPDAPRYRVVLPLGQHIQELDLNEAVMKASTQSAAKKLGLKNWCTPESWVISQPMYLPAKLKDGVYWEGYTGPGKAWRMVRSADLSKPPTGGPADIPDEREDPVLVGLKRAGHYLHEDPKHPGKHFIVCPFVDQHGTENDTQTVYYEAHHDGNPRPAVKCFDTEPDHDGAPHLTYKALVNWLRDNGHITKADENQDTSTALEDYDTFQDKASISRYLDTVPEERVFAWDKFTPVGKVTVLAGPGGVSKSMMMLHLMVHGALGRSWAGFEVSGPVRGLYVSYEDDTLELHKRVNRLASSLRDADEGMGGILYDINGALSKNLMLYAADDDALNWLIMSKFDQRSAPERTARVEWLIGFIKHARLKVIVVDPVVYTHNLEENNSGDMALYMQTLTYIAKAGDCAVVVLHHMAKTAQWMTLDDINQGSLRGASAFADNSRSVGVMVSMPTKDAPRFGLPTDQATVSRFAVFKHVKHNYSASMGSVVFERKGPLLIPRMDIEPLPPELAKEREDDARAKARQSTVEHKSFTVIGWLLDQDDGAASINMIRNGTGIRYALFKEVITYCLDQGWIQQEQGPNRIVFHTATKVGKKWFEDKEKELKKTAKQSNKQEGSK